MYVELVAKGVKDVERGLDQIKKGLDKVDAKAKTTFAKFSDSAKAAFEKVHRAATWAFAGASAAILHFVRAGLQGTTEGERMAHMFQLLSREIAAIFLPAIRFVTDKVQQLTSWFRSLTRQQQEQISKWAMVTLGVLALLVALPKLIAVISALIVVAKAAGAAMMTIVANPILLGITAITAAIGLCAVKLQQLKGAAANAVSELERFEKGNITESDVKDNATYKRIQSLQDQQRRLETIKKELAIALDKQKEAVAKTNSYGIGGSKSNFAVGTATLTGEGTDIINAQLKAAKQVSLLRQMRDAELRGERFKPKSDDHMSVTQQGRGFEAVQEAFRRVQTAALKTDVPKEQLAEQKKTNEHLAAIRGKTPKPAVTN